MFYFFIKTPSLSVCVCDLKLNPFFSFHNIPFHERMHFNLKTNLKDVFRASNRTNLLDYSCQANIKYGRVVFVIVIDDIDVFNAARLKF